MKTNTATIELESRAAEALAALLGQVSGVKLKAIRRAPADRGQAAAFLAHIEVFGHSHTLACELQSDAEPSRLRAVLRDFLSGAPQLHGDATLVVIAPCLSPEAQALCKDSHAGFLDLEGNARLSVGELFIGMRSLPCRATNRPAVASAKPPARFPAGSVVRSGFEKLPQNHAQAALIA